MTDSWEVSCRPRRKRTLWAFVGLGWAGAVAAVAPAASTGKGVWLVPGLLCALAGFAALHRVTVRVGADGGGLHSRTLLRRRSVPWSEVAELRIRVRYAHLARGQESRRVSVRLRDGRRWELPLPRAWTPRTGEFDATLDRLRALHRRHGSGATTAEPGPLTVISGRTTGSGRLGSVVACVLLLAGAALAARTVPDAGAYEREWESATPCAPGTPAAVRGDCLRTVRAVIARTEPDLPKKTSWLYFTDDRPMERLAVSSEAAEQFRAGDRVRLTVWRGVVKEVAGDRHVWREHTPGAGDFAMLAAALVLAAGYPAARVLLRVRGRRRPDGEVLPSALPFGASLVVTALWLLPLCYLHPAAPFASPTTTVWTSLGTLTTLTLLVWAWRATRIRPPGEDGEPGVPADQEVFLPARFLDATDYNPHHFGTHVVVGGDGPPAVVPHPGPGRFAARPLPVSRLTLTRVRPIREGDADTIPGNWHVAELDDAGTPVRLAAAPADLTRILRALHLPRTPAAPVPEAGTVTP
ncbi:PH domain-containing protein [Streptomyces sp. NPDC052079]|uniref:PH domain-containing protein n=1 Tax=Streptomyces sp. NPDC052079 TaxID=3155526 RepID=UPI00342332BC